MEEEWRPIKDYEGLYEVSNMGRVRSLNYKNTKEERILKLTKDKRGYLRVPLTKDKKRKIYRVHRLVALTFIPNIENKPCIDHINTIKTDNRVENLRWTTLKENNNNELSRKHNSESNKDRKLSEEHKYKIGKANGRRVYCVELDMIFDSLAEAERVIKVKHGNISTVCNGKRKTAGGYHWRYVEE